MKFDPEIARNILLDIEEIHEYPEHLVVSSFERFPRINSLDKNVILYHLKMLKEAGFVYWKVQFGNNKFYNGTLSGLTYEGHQFLDTVRSPKIWRDTKERASKIGVFTLDFLSQTAANIISDLIKNQ
ncbi:DUF2513 domain-containing protein [Streptococcus vestibularis]